MMDFVRRFEENIERELGNCGVAFPIKKNIALGVSGGADSIALLTAVMHIAEKQYIKVISVNHNIRPELETVGDSKYVFDYCAKNGVLCEIHEITRGGVEECAKKRNGGIEEAARFLRYEVFEAFIEKHDCAFFCTAHNRNDQLETLLMRFLQGSSDFSGAGIKSVRGKYIRPLLKTSRNEIEEYLKAQNISWRTDKTNFDESMLRNRIRASVLPLFSSLFAGWDNAVLSGAKKQYDDAVFIDRYFNEYLQSVKSTDKYASIDKNSFISAPNAIKRRLVYYLIDKVKTNCRVPYRIVESICKWTGENTVKNDKIEFAGITVFIWNNFLCADIIRNNFDDCVFIKVVEKDEIVSIPTGELKTEKTENGIVFCLNNGEKEFCIKGLTYPFLIRSVQPLDKILSAQKAMRDVSKIIANCAIKEAEKWKVPLVQELQSVEQKIVAIFGCALGKSDWIVKDWES